MINLTAWVDRCSEEDRQWVHHAAQTGLICARSVLDRDSSLYTSEDGFWRLPTSETLFSLVTDKVYLVSKAYHGQGIWVKITPSTDGSSFTSDLLDRGSGKRSRGALAGDEVGERITRRKTEDEDAMEVDS